MTRAKARRIIDVLKEMQKSAPARGESDESNFLNELEAEIDGMSWRNKLTWTPTYYEYLAFYGVAVLIVAIFGINSAQFIIIVHRRHQRTFHFYFEWFFCRTNKL